MNHLPKNALLRLKQVLGDPKAEPPIPSLIPVSKTTWWLGIKAGKYPQPVKLGDRAVAWRIGDIEKLIESFEARGQS
jgi:predicted DNA-binding transcriptional regulator AlpA